MAESTKDLVAKRDMQLKMFDNMPNDKDRARQAKLDKDSSPEGARKAGKKKFFEMYEDDGRTPKNKKREMKDMKKMNMGGMAKAYKDGGEVEKKDKKAEKLKKNKAQAYKQSKKVYEAEESLPEGSIRKKIVGATDKIGDKIRGSSVGKLAKKMGTGTFSRDDEAQMKARKEVKGYKKGGKIRGYGMARGGKVCKMR
jgi:hypothetical protein|tara:strand:- start:20 stop:610 length:591 start_codon:yes stop_codon:yes gene_type:complete